MTSHISELQGNIATRISAGGSLRKEQTIQPLARFAYFKVRTILGSARTIRTLSRDNDSRVLPLDDLRYMGAAAGIGPAPQG